MSEHPLARRATVLAAGFSRTTIRRAVAAGDLVQPGRGVIAVPSAMQDPDLKDAVICLLTGGVIALQSAAQRHSLARASLPAVDVLVPYEVTRPAGRQRLRLIRTRDPRALEVGVESRDVLGVPLRMTSQARTVVDLWRLRKKVSDQFVWEALQTYLDDGGDQEELRGVAEEFGVRDELDIAISAHLTAPSRSN